MWLGLGGKEERQQALQMRRFNPHDCNSLMKNRAFALFLLARLQRSLMVRMYPQAHEIP